MDTNAPNNNLTPPQIVEELDRYIIAQDKAKRAVAIALRNRWRRLQVEDEIKEELTPKNIIMIGPTGVGKTEISRRLAKLVKAPFVKVEATRFTEVGYIGRDVESIIRDLVEMAHTIIKKEEETRIHKEAEKIAQERLLDLLLPGSEKREAPLMGVDLHSICEVEEDNQDVEVDLDAYPLIEEVTEEEEEELEKAMETRQKLKDQLLEGQLDERIVEIETIKPVNAQMQIVGPQGFGELEEQLKDAFSNMIPKQRELRKLSVKDAREYLIQQAKDNLLDHSKVAELAVKRAEETGLVFLDEIDKICGSGSGKGPDVSREGVQRDLLPLVEGSTVGTRYGSVRTDHILFIASGAFHVSKPSDLMPEFQGRFPIRVELDSLTPEHFVRILTEPKNALIKQYQALLETEKVEVEFNAEAVKEIAKLTAEVNSQTENIGARRLHTLMEKLLEDLSFSAHDRPGEKIVIDKKYVNEKLNDIVVNTDLSRFIL